MTLAEINDELGAAGTKKDFLNKHEASVIRKDVPQKRQYMALALMLMTESEHTDFAKSCLCLYIGDACCQAPRSFYLCPLFQKKKISFQLKTLRTYPTAPIRAISGTHIP